MAMVQRDPRVAINKLVEQADYKSAWELYTALRPSLAQCYDFQRNIIRAMVAKGDFGTARTFYATCIEPTDQEKAGLETLIAQRAEEMKREAEAKGSAPVASRAVVSTESKRVPLSIGTQGMKDKDDQDLPDDFVPVAGPVHRTRSLTTAIAGLIPLGGNAPEAAEPVSAVSHTSDEGINFASIVTGEEKETVLKCVAIFNDMGWKEPNSLLRVYKTTLRAMKSGVGNHRDGSKIPTTKEVFYKFKAIEGGVLDDGRKSRHIDAKFMALQGLQTKALREAVINLRKARSIGKAMTVYEYRQKVKERVEIGMATAEMSVDKLKAHAAELVQLARIREIQEEAEEVVLDIVEKKARLNSGKKMKKKKLVIEEDDE